MKSIPVLLILCAGFLAIFACTNPIMEGARPKKDPPPVVTYTVTFDSNGGSAVPIQTVAEGGRATRPGNPKKTDYDFVNWYTNTGLTALFDFNTPITANTTLYAKWKLIEMVWIPAGTFLMGSPENEPPLDATQHKVTLTKGFYMGIYPVTQAQYEAVMGNNPSHFNTPVAPETSTAKRPVETVSWYEALVFCNKLSMQEGLNPAYRINGSTNPANWGSVPTGSHSPTKDAWDATQMVAGSDGYRLPTDAQWEYACRAGTTTAYNTGDTISDDTGWYEDNSGGRTHEVGLKTPNAFGLYDMHGNLWEWCWDWIVVYTSEEQTDPTGPVSGNYRVIRGGSFQESAPFMLSAFRSFPFFAFMDADIGFRVVRP